METKNNILENLLHLATRNHITDTWRTDKLDRSETIISNAYFSIREQFDCMGKSFNILGENKVDSNLLSKLYLANVEGDIESIDTIKKELRDRVEVNFTDSEIKEIIKNKFYEVRLAISKSNIKVYKDHILNLLDKAYTFFNDGNNTELENVLRISHSYLKYVANRGKLVFKTTEVEDIILLNKLLLPSSYYLNLN